ncbi:hypothetical protein TNCV_3087161 [Trichonephila clavipes]|nr:hypothetical protein TNCV_3087161 [Trichonephila clavipes]
MRPLVDAGKNGWTVEDSSVMMVAVDIRPQQNGCSFCGTPAFLLLQDNVRPYTARVAMNCLTAYQALPWPARLTDLSNQSCLGHDSGSESDSLTINGSESDSEITDCFENSVSESVSIDDGSVVLRVMLAFLSHV